MHVVPLIREVSTKVWVENKALIFEQNNFQRNKIIAVLFRLGMLHKEDQIICINGTYVKDLSLAGVVELLAKSGSRVKIEFLTVHALKEEDGDDDALTDRYVPSRHLSAILQP